MMRILFSQTQPVSVDSGAAGKQKPVVRKRSNRLGIYRSTGLAHAADCMRQAGHPKNCGLAQPEKRKNGDDDNDRADKPNDAVHKENLLLKNYWI